MPRWNLPPSSSVGAAPATRLILTAGVPVSGEAFGRMRAAGRWPVSWSSRRPAEARTARPSGPVGRLEASVGRRVAPGRCSRPLRRRSGPAGRRPAGSVPLGSWRRSRCHGRVRRCLVGASVGAGHALRPRSLAKSRSPETRLETRTKECKRRASRWVTSAVRLGGRRSVKPSTRVKA